MFNTLWAAVATRDAIRGRVTRIGAAVRDLAESEQAARARELVGSYRDRWQRSRLRVDPALVKQLLDVLEEETFPGIAPLRTTVFDKAKCPHCLGLHSRKCPAVREIEYHPDGRVMRVSYFERWSDAAVPWREDLEEAAASGDTAGNG